MPRKNKKTLSTGEEIASIDVEKSEIASTLETVAAGSIIDCISGLPVRGTPEEIGAVQVFARRLVEDFDYPKNHITTRPQYRVRRRPSDEAKSYPVDIAVFSKSRRHDSDLLIVVECKAEDVKAGRKQLEIYLTK